ADLLRKRDLGLAVNGPQGEVGRRLVELGTRLERTDLLPEQPANQRRLAGSIAARHAPRRRREGRLEIRPREEARPFGVRGAEERLQFLARELAVAVAIEPGKHEGTGRGRRVAAREIKVGLCEYAVAIAIEPREIGIAAGKLLAGDPAVAIAVKALAGGVPVEAGLGNGGPEPAILRA